MLDTLEFPMPCGQLGVQSTTDMASTRSCWLRRVLVARWSERVAACQVRCATERRPSSSDLCDWWPEGRRRCNFVQVVARCVYICTIHIRIDKRTNTQLPPPAQPSHAHRSRRPLCVTVSPFPLVACLMKVQNAPARPLYSHELISGPY